MEKRGKKKVLVFLSILVMAAVIIAVYLLILDVYVRDCKDLACFQNAMQDCKKASFVSDMKESIWLYNVRGRSENGTECIVNAKLIEIKEGANDLEAIKNLDMDCYLPLGYVANPQDDLSRCHGILKEEMQNLIIKRMHSYILKNVGRISEELTKTV